jgi:error-prone DNA polymerase
MRFVELHARSAFSFLEGASVPEALAYVCAKQQLPAMAVLDRNGLYGSPRFHMIAKSNGIKSHVGAELSVGDAVASKSSYYPLLVESRVGYQNLCRLITKTKLRTEKNKPTVATLAELEEHAEGLICLTGDEDGPLATALKSGGKGEARRWLDRLKSIVGGNNVYVELQRHFRPEQEHRNHAAIDLARELRLPILASNGVRYATPDDRQVLDALTCVKHKCTLDEAGDRLQINSQRHVRSGADMLRIFADLPEAIGNTCELSSRLEFSLENLGYEFPRFPVSAGETEIGFLRAQVAKGALERYQPVTDRARRQLERELKLIEKLKLAGYFLIVWDLVKFCRENHILVQGRGSAANSAVCYSLGITAVDPIAMELLFERFLF